jgi:hypothetical protein
MEGRYPAESRLKRLLSGFRAVKQVVISRLKAERRGEKVTYRGRLSYKNNDSIVDRTVLNRKSIAVF